MGFLAGKKALIFGVLSNKSIAYGIAQSMRREGADIALTYLNEKMKDRCVGFADEFDSNICIPCDVSSDEDIANVFVELKKHWDKVDIIVHAVAFAPAEQLEGEYLDNVTREGFRMAHDISSYSFAAIAKAAGPMMEGTNGSLLTLTYEGSRKVIQNYNVMGLAKASLEANVRYMANSLGPKGIRVNTISAGPIRTLAASGIKGFRKMLNHVEKINPLRELTTIEQVGNSAAFLCSDLAAGITGETLHVDCGNHSIGMVNFE